MANTGTTKYRPDQLRTIWHLVRNGAKLVSLAERCSVDEDVAKEMYRQAYVKFGGPDLPNMPRPLIGERLLAPKKKIVKYKRSPLFTEYLIKPEDRPASEYSNQGYLSLLKQNEI